MSRYKNVKAEATSKAVPSRIISINQPKISSVYLEVEGTAPLIQHCFSQKSVEEMLRKHMGISVQKEKKNPRQVLEDATIYNTEKAISIPPTAFKMGMISQAVKMKGLTKTALRSTLFIEGGSIPITFSRMVPRMDMCRLSGMGRTPDVRGSVRCSRTGRPDSVSSFRRTSTPSTLSSTSFREPVGAASASGGRSETVPSERSGFPVPSPRRRKSSK